MKSSTKSYYITFGGPSLYNDPPIYSSHLFATLYKRKLIFMDPLNNNPSSNEKLPQQQIPNLQDPIQERAAEE